MKINNNIESNLRNPKPQKENRMTTTTGKKGDDPTRFLPPDISEDDYYGETSVDDCKNPHCSLNNSCVADRLNDVEIAIQNLKKDKHYQKTKEQDRERYMHHLETEYKRQIKDLKQALDSHIGKEQKKAVRTDGTKIINGQFI